MRKQSSIAMAVIVLLVWQRPDPFATPRLVRADVADASGLTVIGADVRVAGVPVGKVTGVARVGNVARLTLTQTLLEHASRCQEPDYQSCPDFHAMVLARLDGMDLAEAWTTVDRS